MLGEAAQPLPAPRPAPAAGNFLSPAEQLSSNGFRTVMEVGAGRAAACPLPGCFSRALSQRWSAAADWQQIGSLAPHACVEPHTFLPTLPLGRLTAWARSTCAAPLSTRSRPAGMA